MCDESECVFLLRGGWGSCTDSEACLPVPLFRSGPADCSGQRLANRRGAVETKKTKSREGGREARDERSEEGSEGGSDGGRQAGRKPEEGR